MARCVRCLLPSEVPGAALDAGGTCHFCRTHDPNLEQIQETERRRYEEDLERTLRDTRGEKGYDAVVFL